jgi:hypothetical protein
VSDTPDVTSIRDYWKCPYGNADESYDPETSECMWFYICDNPAPNGDADRCQNCPERTDDKFNPYRPTE